MVFSLVAPSIERNVEFETNFDLTGLNAQYTDIENEVQVD